MGELTRKDARGEALSAAQYAALAAEGRPPAELTTRALAEALGQQVEVALNQLRPTDAASLTEPRAVGRKRFASTVLDLLVHAAEHTMWHVGQPLVTVRMVS